MYVYKSLDFGTGVPVMYWQLSAYAIDYDARVFTIRLKGWTALDLCHKAPLSVIELEFSDRKREQMREAYVNALTTHDVEPDFKVNDYAFDHDLYYVDLSTEIIYEWVCMHPEMKGAEIVNE